MTTYAVNTTPQAIFPDGQNVAMSLFNQGPWTIFVDDNSSVGSQSYALKPAMSMVWPSGTPLWARGNALPSNMTQSLFGPGGNSIPFQLDYQPSTLMATRNPNPGSSQLSSVAKFPIRHSIFNAVTNLVYVTDYPFEADSFQSLIFTLRMSPFKRTGITPDITKAHAVNFVWFDELGNIVTTDKFTLWYQGYDNSDTVVLPQSITVDVKGKYCSVYDQEINSVSNAAGQWEWNLAGSTARLPERADSWIYQTLTDQTGGSFPGVYGYSPIWWRNLQRLGIGSDFAYVESWDGVAPILLNNVADKLSVNIRAAGIGTAGNLHIHAYDTTLSGGAFLFTQAVATGTNTYDITLTVPTSMPLYIIQQNIVGTLRLNFTWSN